MSLVCIASWVLHCIVGVASSVTNEVEFGGWVMERRRRLGYQFWKKKVPGAMCGSGHISALWFWA